MTIAEILLADFDTEISNTRRTLELVPEDKADWVPHAKSMKMGTLAMQCAIMPCYFGLAIAEDEGINMAKQTRPRIVLEFESREKAITTLEEYAAKTKAAITAASDEHLLMPWKFSMGDNVLYALPRHQTIRLWCTNTLIHLTAQLRFYLRLLDIPLPGLYGPSANDKEASQAS